MASVDQACHPEVQTWTLNAQMARTYMPLNPESLNPNKPLTCHLLIVRATIVMVLVVAAVSAQNIKQWSRNAEDGGHMRELL